MYFTYHILCAIYIQDIVLQPRSQGLFVVEHVVTEALAKAGCHMTKFSKCCKENFPTIWKIWSCDNQSLPGPSTSRSATEALGTSLIVSLYKTVYT